MLESVDETSDHVSVTPLKLCVSETTFHVDDEISICLPETEAMEHGTVYQVDDEVSFLIPHIETDVPSQAIYEVDEEVSFLLSATESETEPPSNVIYEIDDEVSFRVLPELVSSTPEINPAQETLEQAREKLRLELAKHETERLRNRVIGPEICTKDNVYLKKVAEAKMQRVLQDLEAKERKIAARQITFYSARRSRYCYSMETVESLGFEYVPPNVKFTSRRK